MLRKMTRFPRRVFGEGQEPDARFSLANERTFLAWIRTSMALLAGGVALQIVDLSLQRDLRMVTSLGLVTLGLFCAVWSFLGWARTERALRRHEALQGASGLVVAVVGLVVCATIVVAGVLVTWLLR